MRLFLLGMTASVLRVFSHARKSSLSEALSPRCCLGAARGSRSGLAALRSEAFPDVSKTAIGRPCASVAAWTFVVRPPRLRPMASEPPPFYRSPSGAP